MISIRAAEYDDVEALAEAHIAAWRVAYRGSFPDEYLDGEAFAASRREMWRGWTWNSNGRAALFVAERDGRVVGFGLVGPERGDAAPGERELGEVWSFYLHPDSWGCGAAVALMSRCTASLRAAGFAAAVLWALRDNPRAHAFYAKAGWAPTQLEQSWAPPDMPELSVTEAQFAIAL